MGWKNIKAHFDIEHQVHVTSEGVCIGSPLVSAIIVIGSNGRLLKRYTEGSNADLLRYQQELEADPIRVRALIEAPDVHAASLPVFTFAGGEIIEKRCEKYGWPNVTHDGELMYANMFFKDRAKALKAAIAEAEASVELSTDRVEDAESTLEKAKARLTEGRANLEKLLQTA